MLHAPLANDERETRSSHEHESFHPTHAERDAPAMEPWLKATLWSVAPILAAVVLPRAFALPLAASSFVILPVGMLRLYLQQRRKRTG